MMEIQGEDEEEITRTREAMKLQVMLDAAHQRLELLEKYGAEENAVAIAQTRALISSLNGEINGLVSENKDKRPGGLFALFGLDVSPQEERMVLAAWKRSLSSITRAYQEAVQLQIDAKQNQ